MVSNYRRTVSFPDHPNSSHKSQKPSRHSRSLSLPCGSHPLIFQLKDEINELKEWALMSDCRTSAWLCSGLIQLKKVQESVDDLLQLPQPRELMRGHNDLVEKLLQDFLVFVDVYGDFQTLILKLKEEHTAAQVAARRRDESKLATCSKGMKKTGKEMGTLAAIIQCIGKQSSCSGAASGNSGYGGTLPRAGCLTSRVNNEIEPELTGLIEDVINVTISVSSVLLNGISVGLECKKPSWRCLQMKKIKVEEGIQEFEEIGSWSFWDLRKMEEEELKLTLKRMDEVEDCLCEIQMVGERVFRSLLNTRVTLLNVLTL